MEKTAYAVAALVVENVNDPKSVHLHLVVSDNENVSLSNAIAIADDTIYTGGATLKMAAAKFTGGKSYPLMNYSCI